MKHFVLFFIVYLWAAASPAQTRPDSTAPLTIGQVNTFYSAILNEKRTLNIYLPPAYDSTKTYPVIYVLDGGVDEDFIHITGLVQFFNLIFNMPETIVAGIVNVNRKRDFTFQPVNNKFKEDYPGFGHSAKFIEFIEKELQPFVQTHYKTNDEKYLIGQSLGGLLATEILAKKPVLFSHYLIVSPSLWWDNQALLPIVQQQVPRMPEQVKYIYLSVGKNEPPVMLKDARALYGILNGLKGKNRKWYFKLMPDNHATILHNSIYEAFLTLFPYKEIK